MRSAGPNTVCVWREDVLPGSETFILNQVRACRRWSGALSGLRACRNGLEVRADFTLETDKPILNRLNHGLYRHAGSTPRLQRHLSGTSVVHAHFGPDGARVTRAARLARRPLVVTFHGYDATIPAAALGIDYSALFQHASRLIAVSGFIARKLAEAGAPEEKIAVMPIGIPLAPEVPHWSNPRHLLFVGRLVPKKGCADLIEALSGIPAAPPLMIIGDGPLRGDLERLARRLRVNATFAGARDPGYVAEAMAASIALCVPAQTAPNGDQEGLGMVFLEAAALSRPTVSYASGGVPEAVIHGETGLLAAEGNVRLLAEYLTSVVGDADLAGRLGAAGRRRVETDFDIDKRAVQLEELYDDVARASVPD